MISPPNKGNVKIASSDKTFHKIMVNFINIACFWTFTQAEKSSEERNKPTSKDYPHLYEYWKTNGK